MTTIFLSAGDASGELHTAALARALREKLPGVRLLGLGGAEMEKAGVELVVHQRELAIGGFVEVLRDLGRIVRCWRALGRALRESRPDLVVLTDSPDFNIPFARRAASVGAPVLYYVSPQVWAWRRYRIRKLARRVDRMAVIFPFEADVYAGSGLPVEFVGHPLVDTLPRMRAECDPGALRHAHGLDTDAPLVVLLPGSRRNELQRTLPLQLESARAVHAVRPDVQFAIATAASISSDSIEEAVAAARLPAGLAVSVHRDATYELLCAADIALAKPGTVTMEIALLGTPMVVAHRLHPVTAAVGRRIVSVPSFTMPNLVAGAPVVPEFIQEAARPERIADALLALLEGPAADEQRRRIGAVIARLGRGGSAQRAAEIAVEMIDGPGRS